MRTPAWPTSCDCELPFVPAGPFPPGPPLPTVRNVTYFKRYKMEVDLVGLPVPQWPAGFHPVFWSAHLLEAHAEVLFRCFHREIDSQVFPSLGDRAGCGCLMTEISRKAGFLPAATWLLAGPDGYGGTVQGVRERGMGAIQNLGIVPAWRGRGLGEALLLLALEGFRRAGLGRAMLEVTAQNEGAIRLYRRLGFRRSKTLYKAAPTF
jgi:ribosomal protein S18 acetylase RimI-like enzyme